MEGKMSIGWVFVIGALTLALGYLLSDYMDAQSCDKLGIARTWGIFHSTPSPQPPPAGGKS